MQALYWHPVCESVLTLSLITPGWELDPSQHAGGWPLLSLQEAGPLSACCLVATGQHQCHHFIITQADSWTSLSKQEALSQSALHLHFNPTARLKEGPLSPDLWNGDICDRDPSKLILSFYKDGRTKHIVIPDFETEGCNRRLVKDRLEDTSYEVDKLLVSYDCRHPVVPFIPVSPVPQWKKRNTELSGGPGRCSICPAVGDPKKIVKHPHFNFPASRCTVSSESDF